MTSDRDDTPFGGGSVRWRPMRPIPPLPDPDRGHRRPAGRRLGRDVALGPSVAAGLPADPLGPRVLLGRRDRGRGGLVVRPAAPVGRVADARRRADPDPDGTRPASRWRAARSPAGSSSARACRRRTADVVARAIVLHMQPSVTLDDGVEAVLLDRATGLDVRGVGYDARRSPSGTGSSATSRGAPSIATSWPRSRARPPIRPTCQSARLLHETGLAAGWRRRRGRPTDGRTTVSRLAAWRGNLRGWTSSWSMASYHGAWCWDRLTPELERLGHHVIAMDLPITDPALRGRGLRRGPS